MTFVTPKTWVVGEVLSAADMNTYVRDNTESLANGYRFFGRRIFDTAGTFTFSKSDPMGDGSVDGSIISAYRIICVGGGGAGAGGKTTGAGECSPAGGGCSGAYAERFILASSLASSETVVVGAAGVPAAGDDGGDGGQSTFSSGPGGVSAPGGRGGVVRAAVITPPSSSQSPFLPSGTPTGDITNEGQLGQGALVADSQVLVGGNGGSSLFGSGGSGQDKVTGSTLSDATGFGAGGGGRSVSNGSSGATSGGNGTNGIVIIELYA